MYFVCSQRQFDGVGKHSPWSIHHLRQMAEKSTAYIPVDGAATSCYRLVLAPKRHSKEKIVT